MKLFLNLEVNRLNNALKYKSSWFDPAKLEGMDVTLNQQAEKAIEEYATLETQGKKISQNIKI
ncbi:MAG: hypothetical protein ACXWL2_02020 [Candidatus Chromulinivorax sp.]